LRNEQCHTGPRTARPPSATTGACWDTPAATAGSVNAQNALSAARGEYRQRYRTALDGGWTDTQLTDVDCPAARGRDTLGQRGRGHKSPPPRTAPTETAEPEPADQDPEHVRATDDDSKAAQASPDAPAPAA